jgi:hypothetical protein
MMPNNICWIKLVYPILCLVHMATATLSEINVDSFVLYKNSRVFCLHITDYDADELMQNRSLHITLGVLYKSNRQVVVNVGNHPCHKKVSQRDLCGYIPETVDTSAFILPQLLSGRVTTTNQWS